ncbi:MAG: sugar ABC transporter ATP-binding protein, partial [Armatimonadaceae bacterium]
MRGVDFTVDSGEVVALLGENGAGKSTLLKAITGSQPPDAGTVRWQGNSVVLDTPAKARALGIRMVYQELNLAPHLSVAANICLGSEPIRGGWIDHRAVRRRAQEVLESNGFDIDPDARVESLGPAQRQLVEIARALAEDAKLLLLDEPTSSLGEQEIENLFATLRRLKDKGLGIVYVSHRLPECFAIADRFTILRDGEKTYEAPVADTDTGAVVRAMVGRDLSDFYPRAIVEPGLERLRVDLPGVSFVARAGEVLGIAGLTGSGRSRLLRTLFGMQKATGSVALDGAPLPIGSGPRAAIRRGVGLLTEDRKKTGLALALPVRHNITLAALQKIAPGPWMRHARDREAAAAQVQALRVKTSSTETPVGTLSGGNQQKVVLGRWIHAESSVLLFDEPTRGVDVGSKVEIYERIN